MNTPDNRDNKKLLKNTLDFLTWIKDGENIRFNRFFKLHYCCLPYTVFQYYIIILLMKVSPSKELNGGKNPGQDKYTLLHINAAWNCLVFFWMNREFRKEGFKIVKKYFIA